MGRIQSKDVNYIEYLITKDLVLIDRFNKRTGAIQHLETAIFPMSIILSKIYPDSLSKTPKIITDFQ